MIQVVTVYAGQRVLHDRYDTKRDAQEAAESIYIDAPVQVVRESDGLLLGTVDARGWHRDGETVVPVEAA